MKYIPLSTVKSIKPIVMATSEIGMFVVKIELYDGNFYLTTDEIKIDHIEGLISFYPYSISVYPYQK